MKKSLLLALLGTAALAGCKKDEKATEKELADKRWKLTAGTFSVGGLGGSILDDMDACEKDNIWITKADHTNGFESGALKCDSSEASSGVSGTWKLQDKKTLVVTGANFLDLGSTQEMKLDIVKSDGKILQVKTSVQMPADSGFNIPISISADLTFTAQ